MGAEDSEKLAHAAGPAAHVRPMTPADATAVARIAEASPEAATWAAHSYAKLEEKGCAGWVIGAAGELAGFLVGRRVGDEAEILNLAVAPEARRRGHATVLLQEALRQFAGQGVRKVFLEVRESNQAAIGFYSKRGFRVAGRREAYYQTPPESALCMELRIGP
jgi:ribosomal-protein-alanine N-acetyltransferase